MNLPLSLPPSLPPSHYPLQAFEVEMEENALTDLYESEIPVLDDVIQTYSRMSLWSTMNIIQVSELSLSFSLPLSLSFSISL